jgi:hypothetical protein
MDSQKNLDAFMAHTEQAEESLAEITAHISALNQALGHKRGTPQVTLDTATEAQRPLVVALMAWREAHQARLNFDSAWARANRLQEEIGQ